jgi:ubiquinone/menaquinone biosynthesis C-methylase UbiE
MEWYFTVLPHLHEFVPTETILEIAPGFGRWTQFLVKLCKNLTLVDLSGKCIAHCQKTFNAYSHIKYHVNDGKSLDMIQDESIDFVFSFDSLIHAEEDVIEAYLQQLAKKLKKNGVGFIHHSNIGTYKTYFSVIGKIPKGVIKKTLIKLGVIDPTDYWRAHSMTADKFKCFAEKAGLRCLSQEMINWRTKNKLIDCISVFARKDSDWTHREEILKNKNFMKEVNQINRLSRLYNAKNK